MTKNFSLHIFSLCLLFVLANVVTPFYTMSLFSFLLCAAVSMGLVFLSTVLLNLGQKNKVVFYITTLYIIIAAIYGATTTFFDFFKVLKEIFLPQTSHALLFAALLLIVLFFSLSRRNALFKYSLFTAVICATIAILCFIGGLKSFDFKEFGKSLKPNFNLSIALTFLPVVVLPFFAKDKLDNTKPIFYGVTTGFVGVVLCFLQSVLTFGSNADVNFPYLKAVSIISSGSLFTRLDGLVYFIFFATAIVKIVVCVKTVFLIIKSTKNSSAE